LEGETAKKVKRGKVATKTIKFQPYVGRSVAGLSERETIESKKKKKRGEKSNRYRYDKRDQPKKRQGSGGIRAKMAMKERGGRPTG